ncbi:hypothetical protein [Streptomyces albidoflavus]
MKSGCAALDAARPARRPTLAPVNVALVRGGVTDCGLPSAKATDRQGG